MPRVLAGMPWTVLERTAGPPTIVIWWWRWRGWRRSHVADLAIWVVHGDSLADLLRIFCIEFLLIDCNVVLDF